MATKIEWAQNSDGTRGETWNPVSGCSIVSPGCHNCYAMRMAFRLEAMGQDKYQGTTEKQNGRILWTGKIKINVFALSIPLKKKKPATWFVNSMSDLFHEQVPFEFIDKVFAVMALCPQHTFQCLTKRAGRMAEYLGDRRQSRDDECADEWFDEMGLIGKKYGVKWKEPPRPLPNVWLGVSCEDQQRAEERIPHLLNCAACIRFISAEPLLSPINFSQWIEEDADRGGFRSARPDGIQDRTRAAVATLDQIIAGGESGPGARPCNTDWIRSIVTQCGAAGIDCFVKQLGANVIGRNAATTCTVPGSQCWPDGTGTDVNRIRLKDKKGGDMSEWPEDLRVRQMPRVATAGRDLGNGAERRVDARQTTKI